MKLIKDQKQFNKFIDLLPELQNDEVYFISLSARNKYLSKEEREHYSLGQTEMFGREIAQSKEKLETYTIKKLESLLEFKTTRNGMLIPEKSLVVYMNINPSSMVKAYMQFQKEMSNQISEITSALMNGKNPNYSFVNIQTRELMNCIQKSSSRKEFIDIDCDTKEKQVIEYLYDSLAENGILFYLIETKGGLHFLIKKDTIPKFVNKYCVVRSFNIMNIINKAKELSEIKDVEIMINNNAMVPVPGTMQSDFLVKMF